MTSMFDYDDSINAAFNAKTAGKNLVTAKHEVLGKTGEFLFLAHTDREFALRCQMVEREIESAAVRKMANVSDSKAKLVRALHEEWKLRHANCKMCKTARFDGGQDETDTNDDGITDDRDSVLSSKTAGNQKKTETSKKASGDMEPQILQELEEIEQMLQCMCGNKCSGQFNGTPHCAPGEGCCANAQAGACGSCGQSFNGYNVCAEGAGCAQAGTMGTTAGIKLALPTLQKYTPNGSTAIRGTLPEGHVNSFFQRMMSENSGDWMSTNRLDRLSPDEVKGGMWTMVFTPPSPVQTADRPSTGSWHLARALGAVGGDALTTDRLCDGKAFEGSTDGTMCGPNGCGREHLVANQVKTNFKQVNPQLIIPTVGFEDRLGHVQERTWEAPLHRTVLLPPELRGAVDMLMAHEAPGVWGPQADGKAWSSEDPTHPYNARTNALIGSYVQRQHYNPDAKRVPREETPVGEQVGLTLSPCDRLWTFTTNDRSGARGKTESAQRNQGQLCRPVGCDSFHPIVRFDAPPASAGGIPATGGRSLDGRPHMGNWATTYEPISESRITRLQNEANDIPMTRGNRQARMDRRQALEARYNGGGVSGTGSSSSGSGGGVGGLGGVLPESFIADLTKLIPGMSPTGETPEKPKRAPKKTSDEA